MESVISPDVPSLKWKFIYVRKFHDRRTAAASWAVISRDGFKKMTTGYKTLKPK